MLGWLKLNDVSLLSANAVAEVVVKHIYSENFNIFLRAEVRVSVSVSHATIIVATFEGPLNWATSSRTKLPMTPLLMESFQELSVEKKEELRVLSLQDFGRQMSKWAGFTDYENLATNDWGFADFENFLPSVKLCDLKAKAFQQALTRGLSNGHTVDIDILHQIIARAREIKTLEGWGSPLCSNHPDDLFSSIGA